MNRSQQAVERSPIVQTVEGNLHTEALVAPRGSQQDSIRIGKPIRAVTLGRIYRYLLVRAAETEGDKQRDQSDAETDFVVNSVPHSE